MQHVLWGTRRGLDRSPSKPRVMPPLLGPPSSCSVGEREWASQNRPTQNQRSVGRRFTGSGPEGASQLRRGPRRRARAPPRAPAGAGHPSPPGGPRIRLPAQASVSRRLTRDAPERQQANALTWAPAHGRPCPSPGHDAFRWNPGQDMGSQPSPGRCRATVAVPSPLKNSQREGLHG